MLGQAPFVGYVVADFAPDGTPEPTLDTAFLPSGAEEPEIFVAVASQQPIELEAFAVVQLPYQSVVSGASNETEALRRARSAEHAAQTKLRELEGELAAERQALATREAELQLGREAIAARTTELATERKALATRTAELATERKAGVARDAKLHELESRGSARDAELTALRHDLEQKSLQLKGQEGKLNELSHKLAQAPSPEEASAAAADLTALELALSERGEHVRKLERELREAERIGKELLRQLPPLSTTAAEAIRLATAAELSQKLAKSQADLVATRWALEAAVKRGASAETPEA